MTHSQREDARREIVVRMRGVAPNRVILYSASRIARSFRGRLTGHFTEDKELLTLASLPFAHEITAGSGEKRRLTEATVRQQMQAASKAAKREFEIIAARSEFESRFEVITGTEIESGILAYGETVEPESAGIAASMIDEISENPRIAGILTAGTRAMRTSGPVIALLEPGCDVSSIVDTAERIARGDKEEVMLVLVGQSAEELEELSQRASESLDADTPASQVQTSLLEPGSLAKLAGSRRAGLVIAWLGGTLGGANLGRFACRLDCPLLILR